MADSFDAVARGVLETAVCSHRLGVRVGTLHYVIRTNETRLLSKLTEYFDDLVEDPVTEAHQEIIAIECSPIDLKLEYRDSPREGGKSGRKEEYVDLPGGRVIRKVRTGMLFLAGGEGLQIAAGPCMANDNQVINFLNTQVLRQYLQEGWALCHAAAVTSKGRGLQIAATSGSGKSTLALHLMSRGARFTSNDRLLIRKRADSRTDLAGIPKWPRVNPGTLMNNPDLQGILPAERLRTLTSLPLEELWTLEEKYDVPIRRVFGEDRVQFQAPAAALVLLNWSYRETRPARLDAVQLETRPDLLGLIMKSAGPLCVGDAGRTFGSTQDLRAETYLSHLRGVPTFEATGKPDFAWGATRCLELLDEASP